MAAELPTGTVTFVFTDVEGSTRLLEKLGAEAYAAALATHRSVVRGACVRLGGVEVDTQGDAFFFAFATAPDAMRAAGELVEGLRAGPIAVRVGVHTGTPLVTDEGYVGHDVHRAARIAAAGHGRQVLVSASTAALVDAELVDLGEHRFKDLGAAERVFQLGEVVFPPIRSLSGSNLPVPATPFLGREMELAEVVERLTDPDTRLLTLTGPGGTGKTRLALQAGAEVSHRFPEGVWWVPLAPLRDPALVLSSVAQALEMHEESGRELAETLAVRLGGKRMLLLLDNFEHLLPEAAEAVVTLRDVGGPVVLVTSRERLRLQGEEAYPVPSLASREALELFMARAGSAGVDLGPSPVVEQLCARLDDLPLAIELAAARTVVFSPEQLLDRLSQRLDLLKGARDADPRQQTLRATIEWSYDLLDDDERRLFRSLGVFAGGCSYEAAEQLAGADPDTLQSLLDKSLLRRRDTPVGPRYWMLATIRGFATDQLDRDGRRPELGIDHARFYADLLASRARAVRRREPTETAALEDDLADARAALASALARADAETCSALLVGLWFYWLTRGLNREALAAVDAYLALDWSRQSVGARLGGCLAAGEVLRFSGEPARAAELKREALDLLRAHPDTEFTGFSAGTSLAATLTDLAAIELELGDGASAEERAHEALALRREHGAPEGIAHALIVVSSIAREQGDLDHAYASIVESAELFDAVGSPDAHAMRVCQADLEAERGHLPEAADLLIAHLPFVSDGDDVNDTWEALGISAIVLAGFGRLSDAVAVGAAADALERRTGLAAPIERARFHSALQSALDALDPDESAAAYGRGVCATPEEALGATVEVLEALVRRAID